MAPLGKTVVAAIAFASGRVLIVDAVSGARWAYVSVGHCPITAVAVTSAGPGCVLLATGSGDKTVRVTVVVEGSDRTLLSTALVGHQGAISTVALALCSGGDTSCVAVVTGSWDNTVRVWSVNPWLPEAPVGLRVLHGHTRYVTSAAVEPMASPAGRLPSVLVASCAYDATVRVWTVPLPQAPAECGTGVGAPCAGSLLVPTLASGGGLDVWNVCGSQPLRVLRIASTGEAAYAVSAATVLPLGGTGRFLLVCAVGDRAGMPMPLLAWATPGWRGGALPPGPGAGAGMSPAEAAPVGAGSRLPGARLAAVAAVRYLVVGSTDDFALLAHGDAGGGVTVWRLPLGGGSAAGAAAATHGADVLLGPTSPPEWPGSRCVAQWDRPCGRGPAACVAILSVPPRVGDPPLAGRMVVAASGCDWVAVWDAGRDLAAPGRGTGGGCLVAAGPTPGPVMALAVAVDDDGGPAGASLRVAAACSGPASCVRLWDAPGSAAVTAGSAPVGPPELRWVRDLTSARIVAHVRCRGLTFGRSSDSANLLLAVTDWEGVTQVWHVATGKEIGLSMVGHTSFLRRRLFPSLVLDDRVPPSLSSDRGGRLLWASRSNGEEGTHCLETEGLTTADTVGLSLEQVALLRFAGMSPS